MEKNEMKCQIKSVDSALWLLLTHSFFSLTVKMRLTDVEFAYVRPSEYWQWGERREESAKNDEQKRQGENENTNVHK